MHCTPLQTFARLLILGIAVCIMLFGIRADQPGRQPEPRQTQLQKYSNMPLSFEPYQGQTDTNVQFVSRGLGYTVFLHSDGATLALERPESRSVLQLRLAGAQPESMVFPIETNTVSDTPSLQPLGQ